MLEYKVISTNVKNAEEEMNRWAQEGWRVISSNTISGCSLTLTRTPVIITLERETRL